MAEIFGFLDLRGKFPDLCILEAAISEAGGDGK